MKCQTLFSMKNKNTFKCQLLLLELSRIKTMMIQRISITDGLLDLAY